MPRIGSAPRLPPAAPRATGRTKYVTPDQKAALARCDKVVALLRARITAAARTDPMLKGITAKSITVDTLMDFPSVAVKKNGRVLFDRQEEIAHLRALLPPSLRQVPLGELSPY